MGWGTKKIRLVANHREAGKSAGLEAGIDQAGRQNPGWLSGALRGPGCAGVSAWKGAVDSGLFHGAEAALSVSRSGTGRDQPPGKMSGWQVTDWFSPANPEIDGLPSSGSVRGICKMGAYVTSS